MVGCILVRAHEKRVRRDVEDFVPWADFKNCKFLVESFYNTLEQGETSSFPSKVIWKGWALLKISLFDWEASKVFFIFLFFIFIGIFFLLFWSILGLES